MAADCLFCKIIAGAIPATMVHEDEHAIAFRDIAPAAPTHLLVIPRQHLSGVDAASPDQAPLLGHLLVTAAAVARQAGLDDGYRLVINTGRDGGQTVFHLHIHVLGGRGLHWPPG